MSSLRAAIFQCADAGLTPDERLHSLSRAARGADAELLLCPELFMSGYAVGEKISRHAEPSEGTFSAGVKEIARATGTAIVYGYPERHGGALYNAAQGIGPSGERLCNHRKRVLPPGFEERYFKAGGEQTLFDFAGLRFALLVCYEIEFPEAVRAAAQAGAQAILAPTALGAEWDVVAHRLVPARAFENGVYVLYANHAESEGHVEYLGASCIVGPTGRDIARAGAEAAVIVAEIDPGAVAAAQARLPYLRDLERLHPKPT